MIEVHVTDPWLPITIAECMANASLCQATMSMDDTWPGDTILHTAGWMSTALMVWREYQQV